MKKKSLFLLFFAVVVAIVFASSRFGKVRSLGLTSPSALLDNSRLSFIAALEGAQTAGSSLITLDVTNYTSESVLQLQNGDAISIGSTEYSVNTTIDDASDNKLSLSAGLDSGDVADDTPVIGTQSAGLTVSFTTVSALANGDFRILVPAVGATAPSHDGRPDIAGFDFGASGGTTASVTCPSPSIAGYASWDAAVNTAAETAGVTIDGVAYHSFVCGYTGTGEGESGSGDTTTAFTGSDAFVLSDLINPAPKTGADNHTLGQADTYSVIIQHRSSAGTVIDQSEVKIGVIDAVRVTATVDPQLTFTITGISSGATKCGVTGDVTTTALTVPFGDLTIGYYTDAAQLLTVTTNAANGYSVTAAENDQLGKDGGACSGDGSGSTSCIVDANVTSMTHTTSQTWDSDSDGEVDGSTYGFGYSLEEVSGGSTPAFTTTGATFVAKHFADLAASEAVQTIFSNTTSTNSDQVNVCYRVAPSALNVAGDYENYVVYTASASF